MVLTFFGNRNGGSSGEGKGNKAPAFRALPAVRGYWEGLRGETGAIPARSALDPRGLAAALNHVFVAERIGTGLIRMRIAGMGLTDLAGLDMKGLPLSTLFLPEARLRLALVVERVFSMPVAAEFHLEAERGIGRPALEGRLQLLPLISAQGRCDLVLGTLVTDGQIGRAPRRFGIARVLEERLVLPGYPPAEEDSLVPAPAPTPGLTLAEPPAPVPLPPAPLPPALLPPARPVRGRAHLRLVHSAD